jgi:NAD(P)H-flavin reductase
MDNPHYLMARLLEVQPESPDISSYLFILENGQEIRYLPGQFNMLGLIGVEEAAISFSSLAVPENNQFVHTIRRVGNVTGLVERMGIGEAVMVRGPFGRGWPIEEIVGRDVLLVAGGVGLAPVKPFLLYALENRNRIRNLILVFGARTPEDMIFQQDLAAWQGSGEVTTYYCVDRLTGESPLRPRQGLVTQFFGDLDLDYQNTVACICGPEIMMRFVVNNLLLQGYNENRMYVSMERRMRCGTGHCGHCQIGAKFVCLDGPIFKYPDIRRFSDTLL